METIDKIGQRLDDYFALKAADSNDLADGVQFPIYSRISNWARLPFLAEIAIMIVRIALAV